MILSSKLETLAGPSVSPLPSRDRNEGNEMDFDDVCVKLCDCTDQGIPARQFSNAESGPIAQLLAGKPPWMKMTPEESEKTSTWHWKASNSFGRTNSTWNITTNGNRGKSET